MDRIPNPLRSIDIHPELLADNGEERLRDTTTFEPFAFINTKQHPTLPLSIHNYVHRSFWSSSPLSSYSSQQLQEIIDSKAILSDQNEASLALTLASRSLVTENSTGRVISRSFAKFFNYEEKLAYEPSGREYNYEIQEKVDGSIISLFWYDGLQSSSRSRTFPNRDGGQWVVASRASFSSKHTESAWNVLNTRFPSLVSNTRDSPLDKTKTYVFELVDNQMAIKIRYSCDPDLLLLSVIGNDGSETRLDSTGLPFRRPRKWKLEGLIAGKSKPGVSHSDMKTLSKLQRANEEGFVITFWRTKDDMYPQRVKVKLESYLKLCKPAERPGQEPRTTIDPSSRLSLKHLAKLGGAHTKVLINLNSPPSPRALLAIHTSYRVSIPSFNGIDACMSSVKRWVLEAIQRLNVSDDYGGEAWLAKIAKTWDCIHALSSIHEVKWKDTVKKLERDGYKSGPPSKMAPTKKQNFDNHLAERNMDSSLIPSLKAWFEGQSVQDIVRLVVESAKFPNDLRSTEVIVLG